MMMTTAAASALVVFDSIDLLPFFLRTKCPPSPPGLDNLSIDYNVNPSKYVNMISIVNLSH